MLNLSVSLDQNCREKLNEITIYPLRKLKVFFTFLTKKLGKKKKKKEKSSSRHPFFLSRGMVEIQNYPLALTKLRFFFSSGRINIHFYVYIYVSFFKFSI